MIHSYLEPQPAFSTQPWQNLFFFLFLLKKYVKARVSRDMSVSPSIFSTTVFREILSYRWHINMKYHEFVGKLYFTWFMFMWLYLICIYITSWDPASSYEHMYAHIKKGLWRMQTAFFVAFLVLNMLKRFCTKILQNIHIWKKGERLQSLHDYTHVSGYWILEQTPLHVCRISFQCWFCLCEVTCPVVVWSICICSHFQC